MTIDQAIQVVQVSFPQVYLACHTRHQRKRSTEHRLSSRDAAILAHLDERVPITPARLAAHLGIARSTLSEALKRLSKLGFIRRANESQPATRTTAVLLSAKGGAAIRDTSVLETRRLRDALDGLTSADLQTIVKGMARLAAACRRIGEPDRFSRSA
jgi:DNA-binding MarR family transcriptional regulator